MTILSIIHVCSMLLHTTSDDENDEKMEIELHLNENTK
jgi:hypothetical protein